MRIDPPPAQHGPPAHDWLHANARWLVLGILVLIAGTYATSLRGWFNGDDAVILLDAAAVVQNPIAGFGPGTFGRFRPLRLFSIAAVYAFADTRWVVPYHLLSLSLHLLNIFLAYRLLLRLIERTDDPIIRAVPFAATAIAAVHASGSEAVTYISAIGMLFSTTGTLICCLAVRNLAERPQRKAYPVLQLAAGMLIAIGGGYAMPTLLVVFLCAIWPTHDSPRHLRWNNLAVPAMVVIPLTLLYGLIEKLLIVHDFEKQARFEPLFMLHQLIGNISRLLLPSTFVNEPIVYSMLALAAIAVIAIKPLRQWFLQPRIWLLLVISVAALAPYAPSALGNRHRFCYLPAPFFMAFCLLFASAAFRLVLRKPRDVINATLATGLLLLAVNIAAVQVRVSNSNRCGESLKDFVGRMQALKASQPDQHLRVFMISPDPEQGMFMLQTVGLVKYGEAVHGMPLAPWPPKGETWVIASYKKRKPFETRILTNPR